MGLQLVEALFQHLQAFHLMLPGLLLHSNMIPWQSGTVGLALAFTSDFTTRP